MTKFGSEILASEFPDDDGSADSLVLSLLVQFSQSQSEELRQQLVSAFKAIRVLVPVMANVDEVDEETGADKSSHMSSVIFKSADGRTGLPVFTGVEALNQWDPQARPVPRFLRDVARSAIDEKFDAVLIDMASAHRFALQGISLAEVAGIEFHTVNI
jgi:hypothetical protein